LVFNSNVCHFAAFLPQTSVHIPHVNHRSVFGPSIYRPYELCFFFLFPVNIFLKPYKHVLASVVSWGTYVGFAVLVNNSCLTCGTAVVQMPVTLNSRQPLLLTTACSAQLESGSAFVPCCVASAAELQTSDVFV
jgi:hypothetical protein